MSCDGVFPTGHNLEVLWSQTQPGWQHGWCHSEETFSPQILYLRGSFLLFSFLPFAQPRKGAKLCPQEMQLGDVGIHRTQCRGLTLRPTGGTVGPCPGRMPQCLSQDALVSCPAPGSRITQGTWFALLGPSLGVHDPGGWAALKTVVLFSLLPHSSPHCTIHALCVPAPSLCTWCCGNIFRGETKWHSEEWRTQILILR
jgi:hypothetical protein